MVDDVLKRLSGKQERLRRLLKAKPANFKEQLDEWIRVELTYASNNIEGNTLTRQETAEVIGRGVGAVIARKPLGEIGRVATGQNLLKIGQVARMARVSIPTVRYYLDRGLIRPVSKTAGGFMLFEPQVVKTIGEIKQLQQEERLLISEIKLRLKSKI